MHITHHRRLPAMIGRKAHRAIHSGGGARREAPIDKLTLVDDRGAGPRELRVFKITSRPEAG